MRRFIGNNALLFEKINNVEAKQIEYQKHTDEKLGQIFDYISEHEESNQKAYHVGASIKDAGKKCFGINLIEDKKLINDILQRLTV